MIYRPHPNGSTSSEDEEDEEEDNEEEANEEEEAEEEDDEDAAPSVEHHAMPMDTEPSHGARGASYSTVFKS